MASIGNNNIRNKLITYRILALIIIAFLLVRLNIVNDTNRSHDITLYIFAIIIALPITMLLDKHIIRFAKTSS